MEQLVTNPAESNPEQDLQKLLSGLHEQQILTLLGIAETFTRFNQAAWKEVK